MLYVQNFLFLWKVSCKWKRLSEKPHAKFDCKVYMYSFSNCFTYFFGKIRAVTPGAGRGSRYGIALLCHFLELGKIRFLFGKFNLQTTLIFWGGLLNFVMLMSDQRRKKRRVQVLIDASKADSSVTIFLQEQQGQYKV